MKLVQDSGCATCLLLEEEMPASEHHSKFCDDCREEWEDHFCADCGFFEPKLIGGTWCDQCCKESYDRPLGIEGGPEKKKKAKCDCKTERAGPMIYHHKHCAMIQSLPVSNVTTCDLCWSHTCPGGWGMPCSNPLYAGKRGKP